MEPEAAAAAPLIFLALAGLFLGFGGAGVAGWLAQRDWGIGLLTVALAMAPLLWFLRKAGPSEEAGVGGEEATGLTMTGDELTVLLSALVGLALGLLMLRASEKGLQRALADMDRTIPAPAASASSAVVVTTARGTTATA